MQNEHGSLWNFAEEWRFDEVPAYADFEVYMKSLLTYANGDGNLAEAERNWVLGYCAAFQMSEALIEELRTYQTDEDIREITARSAVVASTTRALVFDSIRAHAADGVLVEDERDAIRRMAGKLGIPKEVVGELEALYAEEQRLRNRRIELVFPDGPPY